MIAVRLNIKNENHEVIFIGKIGLTTYCEIPVFRWFSGSADLPFFEYRYGLVKNEELNVVFGGLIASNSPPVGHGRWPSGLSRSQDLASMGMEILSRLSLAFIVISNCTIHAFHVGSVSEEHRSIRFGHWSFGLKKILYHFRGPVF